MMVRLQENDNFTHTGHDVGLDAADYAEAQKTSLPMEYSFGDVRRTEKKHLNGSLVPMAAYHGFAESARLQEFGRAAVPVTDAARSVAAKRVPSSVFDEDPEAPDEEVFSLGEQVLDTIAEERASWNATDMEHQREGLRAGISKPS